MTKHFSEMTPYPPLCEGNVLSCFVYLTAMKETCILNRYLIMGIRQFVYIILVWTNELLFNYFPIISEADRTPHIVDPPLQSL